MESDIEALVQKIKLGIQEDGSHLVDEDQLALFLGAQHPSWDAEKHRQLDEFARAHGFEVHFSTWLRVAIFRN